MFYTSSKELEYLSIQNTPFKDILHGFFTRKGGVSPAPYTSLNASTSTGDRIDNVRTNRDRIFSALQLAPESSYEVWQVHSDKVVCTEKTRAAGQKLTKADAIFTQNPNITLMMRFADCVPILIYDPVRKVVGIIHAGWQGTINQIARKSIATIASEYGSVPGDICAVIGPSICPEHYEVGNDVYSLADKLFNSNSEIVIEKNGTKHFNLWKANEELLRISGVKQIIQTEVCTACDTERWYSHRAEAGRTGRFAAVISLSS